VVPEIASPAGEALTVALRRLSASASAADIDTLSQGPLFRPRTIALAGAEAALRDRIEELVRGEPRYDRMTAEMAETTRRQLPTLQKALAGFGPLQSITFHEVDFMGGDVFDVEFTNGAGRWTVVLAPDNKMAMAFFRPL
jgi:hypothetical protein